MLSRSDIAALLSKTKNTLVLGVGGGNDSVTLLILLEQLRATYGLHPAHIDIAAMLPDFLEYRAYGETGMPSVWEITPETQRLAQGVRVTGFPEPRLAQNAERFGVGHVWGLDMSGGAEGIAQALSALVCTQAYDLVLACDVGGDFIAAAENYDVLSPMMDGYALYGLRYLQASDPALPIVGAVFGLGTDGESSPTMLRRALLNLGHSQEETFAPDVARDVEAFYRTDVEPKRYSRTADFTLQEIRGQTMHNHLERYRVRYHSRPEANRRRSYSGEFVHTLDPSFYGKYYLFTDFSGIANPFAVRCTSAVDWLLAVTTGAAGRERVHHELVGQQVIFREAEFLCSVPSHKFRPEQIKDIFADTVASVRNGVYDGAFVYTLDVLADPSLEQSDILVSTSNPHVSLLQRRDRSHLSARLPLC